MTKPSVIYYYTYTHLGVKCEAKENHILAKESAS